MGNHSKLAEAQGNAVSNESDIPVADVVEKRSPTSPAIADPEDESQGTPDGGYKPGMTPEYETTDSEHSEKEESETESQGDAEEKEESGGEEEQDMDAQGPSPAVSPAPWLQYLTCGSITQKDVPKSPKAKIEENPKGITKNEYPKDLKRKVEDLKAIKSKEPKHSKEDDEDSPKSRQLNPKDLLMLQQQLIDQIEHWESLKETDNRTLLFSLHTQLASLSGNIQQVSSAIDNLTNVYGHKSRTEEESTRGFANIEELLNYLRRSQGKIRASIEENNSLLREIIKSMDIKEASPALKKVTTENNELKRGYKMNPFRKPPNRSTPSTPSSPRTSTPFVQTPTGPVNPPIVCL
ncbi:hypothetical protein CAEBREN_00667 [Caenorhabditis brenneri]|uniref:Uncharacterized protein n=1 Tax=Caenorhabditis brenneri TaxID=135651 RepID=G0P951_CAEBE|nr:hypothetical protein CAEBREN_00667 [Caenorhabditis brenneri]